MSYHSTFSILPFLLHCQLGRLITALSRSVQRLEGMASASGTHASASGTHASASGTHASASGTRPVSESDIDERKPVENKGDGLFSCKIDPNRRNWPYLLGGFLASSNVKLKKDECLIRLPSIALKAELDKPATLPVQKNPNKKSTMKKPIQWCRGM